MNSSYRRRKGCGLATKRTMTETNSSIISENFSLA